MFTLRFAFKNIISRKSSFVIIFKFEHMEDISTYVQYIIIYI